MLCPSCYLENPPEAWRCDCGHDFRQAGSFRNVRQRRPIFGRLGRSSIFLLATAHLASLVFLLWVQFMYSTSPAEHVPDWAFSVAVLFAFVYFSSCLFVGWRCVEARAAACVVLAPAGLLAAYGLLLALSELIND